MPGSEAGSAEALPAPIPAPLLPGLPLLPISALITEPEVEPQHKVGLIRGLLSGGVHEHPTSWSERKACAATLKTAVAEHSCNKKGEHYDHVCGDEGCTFRWMSR